MNKKQSRHLYQEKTTDELDAMAEKYDAQQKQGYCERQEKRYDRISKYSLDQDNQRMYGARARAFGERAEGFRRLADSVPSPDKKAVETVESLDKPYTEVQDEYFRTATPGKGEIVFDKDCISDQHKHIYERERFCNMAA